MPGILLIRPAKTAWQANKPSSQLRPPRRHRSAPPTVRPVSLQCVQRSARPRSKTLTCIGHTPEAERCPGCLSYSTHKPAPESAAAERPEAILDPKVGLSSPAPPSRSSMSPGSELCPTAAPAGTEPRQVGPGRRAGRGYTSPTRSYCRPIHSQNAEPAWQTRKRRVARCREVG